jgi:hypothetical protein
MRMSHETIYTSLFVRARAVLRPGEMDHPVQLSEIAVHDVDIVEVCGSGPVLHATTSGSGDVYGMTNTCPG